MVILLGQHSHLHLNRYIFVVSLVSINKGLIHEAFIHSLIASHLCIDQNDKEECCALYGDLVMLMPQ